MMQTTVKHANCAFLLFAACAYHGVFAQMEGYGAATEDTMNWEVTYYDPVPALEDAFEITLSPKDPNTDSRSIWVTEREGKRVSSINMDTWEKTTLIQFADDQIYEDSVWKPGQDGLLGMAIHPDLLADAKTITNNYVFVVYTYLEPTDSLRRTRLVRLVYDHGSHTLSEDISVGPNGAIIEDMPGSDDHNGNRLRVGPDNKLYLTRGDQGNNQKGNTCKPIQAHHLPSMEEVSSKDYATYVGKTLRLEIDGSIPDDNPAFDHDDDIDTPPVRSHVYSYGHRNPQGLTFASDGVLYNSEHGPKVDDEVNRIIAGGFYGWPEIAGYFDNKGYTHCKWSESDPFCDSSFWTDHSCPDGTDEYNGHIAPDVAEFEAYPDGPPANFVPPVGTLGTTTADVPLGGWLSWPTVAPSSLAIYEASRFPKRSIPGWNRTLLVPTLKEGTIFFAELANTTIDFNGETIDFEEVVIPDGSTSRDMRYRILHASIDRYRDVFVDPNGVIYAVTDNAGLAVGPFGSVSQPLEHPGKIVKIKYIGGLMPENSEQEESSTGQEASSTGQEESSTGQVESSTGQEESSTVIDEPSSGSGEEKGMLQFWPIFSICQMVLYVFLFAAL